MMTTNNDYLDEKYRKLWDSIRNELIPLSVNQYILMDVFEAFLLCKNLTKEYDDSHDVEHHVKVFVNSIEIYKKMDNCSEEVLPMIIYSSLLHDTIDNKYQENIENKIKILDNFLKEKLGKKWKNIKWIIDNMSYSKETKNGYPINGNPIVQLSRDIVSDADKLEAIGETGILRCKQFSIAKNPNATVSEINKLVLQHCFDKLLKIKDHFIRTNPGKIMAEKLHLIIVDYVNKAMSNENF